MSRCLVTGHKGYIGSALFRELKKRGHEVMGLDFKDEISRDVIITLAEDTDGGFHPAYENFKPEYVFHLACEPRVGYSLEFPVETMHNNIMSTSVVLNFARKVGAKRVIYSSSSSIKGNGDGPTSPYGLQKMTSEIETKLYAELYGIDTVSLRYFNVYSPCQKAEGPYATAIANWMHYIRDRQVPFITGDGEQRRDMLHLNDAVSANIFAMEKEGNFGGEYYDVGTGENISLNQIRDLVHKYFPRVDFKNVPPRPNEVEYTRADTKPLDILGWKTSISIEEGILECFRELRKEV